MPIHGLYDNKKAEDDKKNTTAYNGNGVEATAPDALGLDGIVGKAKEGGAP
jgi:hypothetical protein